MRATQLLITLLVSSLSLPSVAAGFGDLLKQGEQLLRQKPALSSSANSGDLDTATLSKGLKEALAIGGERAISRLSDNGGYLNSSDVKIPLPGFLNTAGDTLRRFGLSSQVDAFERSMNSAAEQAVGEATPLFVDTISNLTLEDAKAIYNGGDTAATDFFQSKMSGRLTEKLRPLINQAMSQTGVTRYYDALMDKASSTIPMLSSNKTDLSSHVTEATLKGLFLRLAQEEKQIRQNPVARSTDLLKTVFGR